MIPKTIKDLDKFDGILWASETSENDDEKIVQVKAMGYKFENRKPKPPDDLGYKYDILTWNNTQDSGEFMSAYIGDIRQFLDNYTSIGYSGLMLKSKSVPKKTIRRMFRSILENHNTSKKKIKEILNQL